MEVKYWVMFFHVGLQSQLGTGQGWGTLAHNMESLSEESNKNIHRVVLSQSIRIPINVAANLPAISQCIDINDFLDTI